MYIPKICTYHIIYEYKYMIYEADTNSYKLKNCDRIGFSYRVFKFLIIKSFLEKVQKIQEANRLNSNIS